MIRALPDRLLNHSFIQTTARGARSHASGPLAVFRHRASLSGSQDQDGPRGLLGSIRTPARVGRRAPIVDHPAHASTDIFVSRPRAARSIPSSRAERGPTARPGPWQSSIRPEANARGWEGQWSIRESTFVPQPPNASRACDDPSRKFNSCRHFRARRFPAQRKPPGRERPGGE